MHNCSSVISYRLSGKKWNIRKNIFKAVIDSAVTENERYLWILGLKTQCDLLVSARREDFYQVCSRTMAHVSTRRCKKPSDKKYKGIRVHPFPKQGTELKKTRPFPTVEHFRHCLNKHMNRQSCFNLVCRGPFVSCANIGTFLVLTKQKAGWVRETDHIHYRKRKLVTLRLRCESVSNSLNISRTKKKCRDNVVRTLWQPSDVQVVVRPVRCCKGCSNWWNFLTMTITIICCDKV